MARVSPFAICRLLLLLVVGLSCWTFSTKLISLLPGLGQGRSTLRAPRCSGAECSPEKHPLILSRDAKGDQIIILNAPIHVEPPTISKGPSRHVKDLIAAAQGKMQGKLRKPKVWTKEELALRSWMWRNGEVESHPTLWNVVAELSSTELKIRNWLLKTRPARLAGEGVGLGLRSSPKPRLDFDDTDEELLSVWTGEGSEIKFDALKLEKDRGLIAGSVDCKPLAKSLQAYELSHRQTLAGHRGLRLMEAFVPATERWEGIADRLLGVATVFLYALVTRRIVAVNWQDVVPFDLLFDSPHGIDWSYPHFPETEQAHPIYGLDVNTEDQEKIYVMEWTKDKLDRYFKKIDWLNRPKRWIRLITNRGLIIRSFFYPRVAPRLKALGFERQTAFSCMMNHLIRPKPSALKLISEYTSVFSLPAVFAIGIEIRTGGDSTTTARLDELNTVKRHHLFFKCADQVAERYALPSQKVVFYLVSDSEHLKAEALKTYAGKVVISGLDAGSSHSTQRSNELPRMEGAMDSVVEWWTLAETDFRIITEHSSFGKIATFLRGQPGQTIAVPLESDLESQDEQGPKRARLDCGSESALVSFDALANRASLG